MLAYRMIDVFLSNFINHIYRIAITQNFPSVFTKPKMTCICFVLVIRKLTICTFKPVQMHFSFTIRFKNESFSCTNWAKFLCHSSVFLISPCYYCLRQGKQGWLTPPNHKKWDHLHNTLLSSLQKHPFNEADRQHFISHHHHHHTTHSYSSFSS